MSPFSGGKYKDNSRKCALGEDPCALCGKGCKVEGPGSEKTLWTHVVGGGSAFATEREHAGLDEVDAAGDMGCFPVGAACAGRLRKAGVYVFTMEG